VADGAQRVALVETRTDGAAQRTIRYQLGNHLGSSMLELDEHAHIISYEEYYPYGSTSYQAGRSDAEVSLKRYRYTGMERDEESGLEYHALRYFAPWLGRWTSADPASLGGGINLYRYADDSPLRLTDTGGADPASVGQAGELPATATLDDLKQYAQSHGYEYSDPDNQRHYVMTDKGGQWQGGILTAHVRDSKTEDTSGFGQHPSDWKGGDDTGTIPTGDYSTDTNSGGDYDPFAPKKAKSTGKTGHAGKGKPGPGGSGGGRRQDGPAGGTPTGAATTPPPPNTPPVKGGGTGTDNKGGSGGEHKDGWEWLEGALEVVLTVVTVVLIAATIWNFGAAFLAAYAVEGATIGTATTIAAGEVMGVGAGGVAAGSLQKINRDLTGGTQPYTRLYQLVDEQGEPVYLGESMDIAATLERHAESKGLNWRGLQIISDEFVKPQGMALEQILSEGNDELILSRESGSLYKLGGNWDPSDFFLPPTTKPGVTFLNPDFFTNRR
jgi:RHS repeat-associated protein